jgi:hypothetical protein
MQTFHKQYLLDDALERLDLPRCHAWLASS